MTIGRLVDKKNSSYNPEQKVYVKGKYHRKGDIVSALKMQEIVKHDLEVLKNQLVRFEDNTNSMVYQNAKAIIPELEYLIEYSQKTESNPKRQKINDVK